MRTCVYGRLRPCGTVQIITDLCGLIRFYCKKNSNNNNNNNNNKQTKLAKLCDLFDQSVFLPVFDPCTHYCSP